MKFNKIFNMNTYTYKTSKFKYCDNSAIQDIPCIEYDTDLIHEECIIPIANKFDEIVGYDKKKNIFICIVNPLPLNSQDQFILLIYEERKNTSKILYSVKYNFGEYYKNLYDVDPEYDGETMYDYVIDSFNGLPRIFDRMPNGKICKKYYNEIFDDFIKILRKKGYHINDIKFNSDFDIIQSKKNIFKFNHGIVISLKYFENLKNIKDYINNFKIEIVNNNLIISSRSVKYNKAISEKYAYYNEDFMKFIHETKINLIKELNDFTNKVSPNI